MLFYLWSDCLTSFNSIGMPKTVKFSSVFSTGVCEYTRRWLLTSTCGEVTSCQSLELLAHCSSFLFPSFRMLHSFMSAINVSVQIYARLRFDRLKLLLLLTTYAHCKFSFRHSASTCHATAAASTRCNCTLPAVVEHTKCNSKPAYRADNT